MDTKQFGLVMDKQERHDRLEEIRDAAILEIHSLLVAPKIEAPLEEENVVMINILNSVALRIDAHLERYYEEAEE